MSDEEFKAFVYQSFNRMQMRMLFLEAMVITLLGVKTLTFLSLF